MRIGSLVAATLAAALANGALAASTQAASVSYDFDEGNEGWTVVALADSGCCLQYEGSASWSSTGGNPNGHISYSTGGVFFDYFFSPSALGTADLGKTLGFDFRSNFDAEEPRLVVFLRGVGEDVGVYCEFGSPSSTAWQRFATVLSPANECWRYSPTGIPATEEHFQQVLASGNGKIEISAGRYSATDATGRLDNVSVTPLETLERKLSIKYAKKKKSFSGKLSAPDLPSGQCTRDIAVELFQKQGGPDKSLGTGTTNSEGKWSVNKKAAKGKKYYARVPEATVQAFPCGAAKSKSLTPIG